MVDSGRKRRRVSGSLALFAILLVTVCGAAQTAVPPSPTQWVTDSVNFMSPGAAAELNSRLGAYEQQTGHQLLVWIGASTGEVSIEDFAVHAFEAWKVGRKGLDDGLVLFIMATDRKLRIEVGYGLEGDVPDARASMIVNDVIVPVILDGDQDRAVIQGMEAVATALGQPLPGQSTAPRGVRDARPLTLGQMILYGIIGLVVLFIFITNPSLAIYLLASALSGGGRGRGSGGGGFGGGGFGGGGGRSGGGGASGSW